MRENSKLNASIFNLKMIEKLIVEPDEKLFDFKSLINKYYQLRAFEKIIENKFAVLF